MSPRQVSNFAAANIAALRNQSKMSRRALVDLLEERGVHLQETSLKRIEDGNQSVKIEEAVAFADIFGQDLETFITEPIDLQIADVMTKTANLGRLLGSIAKDLGTAINTREELGTALTTIGAVQMRLPEAEYAYEVYKQSDIVGDMYEIVNRIVRNINGSR